MAFEAITVKRFWDANANKPFLLAGRGVNGDAYLVTVAGGVDIGQAGGQAWKVGDIAAFVLDRWIRFTGNSLLTDFAAITSAQLAALISDETGSGGGGVLVFNKAPALIDPDVGTQVAADNSGKAASTAFVTAAIAAALAAQSAAGERFTTGDTKQTMRVAADPGWVFLSGKTIGNAVSGATERANADTSALFTYLWTNYSNTLCPVSGGRGASAAADFAANKTLTLADASNRVLAGKNYNGTNRLTTAGSGVDGNTVGAAGGAETHTLTVQQMPRHQHTFTQGAIAAGSVTPRPANGDGTSPNSGTTDFNGSDVAHNNTQPTLVVNTLIKL